MKFGRLVAGKTNKGRSQNSPKENLILGEINPRLESTLKSLERSKEREKEKKAALRTYAPPEDDLILVPTIRKERE